MHRQTDGQTDTTSEKRHFHINTLSLKLFVLILLVGLFQRILH